MIQERVEIKEQATITSLDQITSHQVDQMVERVKRDIGRWFLPQIDSLSLPRLAVSLGVDASLVEKILYLGFININDGDSQLSFSQFKNQVDVEDFLYFELPPFLQNLHNLLSTQPGLTAQTLFLKIDDNKRYIESDNANQNPKVKPIPKKNDHRLKS